MVQQGLLRPVGAGRAARYERTTPFIRQHALNGLEEHVVWMADLEALREASPRSFDNDRVTRILSFAFTEMLNNAIDHSDGTEAIVRWFVGPDSLTFEVEDDGVGVFRKVRETRHLNDDFESVGEISKGKQTTAPEHHSGMGIFFTSKLADQFTLSSGRATWSVDANRNDEAVGWLQRERKGTLVRFEVRLDTKRNPSEVFAAYSDPETFDFTQSQVRVGLFKEDGLFVSRSEAKRIAVNLDDFQHVEIDFSGIDEVGQGFVDELFRVWPKTHQQTKLVPVNANPAVASMIAKASRPGPAA